MANVRIRFANVRMRISNKGLHAICELRMKWKWAFMRRAVSPKGNLLPTRAEKKRFVEQSELACELIKAKRLKVYF